VAATAPYLGQPAADMTSTDYKDLHSGTRFSLIKIDDKSAKYLRAAIWSKLLLMQKSPRST
jgi:hypothetical protein